LYETISKQEIITYDVDLQGFKQLKSHKIEHLNKNYYLLTILFKSYIEVFAFIRKFFTWNTVNIAAEI